MPVLFVEQVGVGQTQRPTDPTAPAEHLLDPRPRGFRQGAAAFQLAVWEFTQEASTFGTQTGTFRSTGPSAVTTLADSYVAAALGYTGTSSYKITKLTSADYQDLVVAAPVPEPESYALFLAGLGAIGLIARRRLPR